MDYAIGEFIYTFSSNINLRIGNVRNYNNKILISSPSFNIGTNVKINLDGEQAKLKDKPDAKPKSEEIVKTKLEVKQKKEPDVMSNKEHKQYVKPNIKLKHDVKMVRKKRLLDIGNYSCLYSMVDVQITHPLLVFVMKYV